MNIQDLARQRAACMANIEALSMISGSDDLEEDRELRLAIMTARRAYRAAEAAYQTAISTLSADELKALGVAA